MREDEVTQWQRAFELYRQAMPLDSDCVVPGGNPGEVIAAVDEKLQRLLSATQSHDENTIAGPLDNLILKLGIGQAYGDEGEALDLAIIGRNIGDWKILSRLGRGGTASVYLAERSGVEFQQQGALKLLSLFMLATGGSARFVREQQFLASLHHPNIAMLLDGGVAEDGTPYLVTEHVEGLNITDYCQQHALDARQIVRLLLQVCEAVSHAHSKLILHRDIKPSNVLITDDGQPKLLDFGIGRLAEEAAESTVSRVFTPKYAAPEQMQGRAVTTATDVYGLGMLGKTLLGDGLPARRELNSVLSKATHTDISRRYTSAESLASDLRNWLANRPISAVPDSVGYRIGKFISRNRAMVAATSMMLLIAIIGIGAVLWQAHATRLEADKSRTISEFMIGLFADGDLLSGQGPETPISTLMQSGAVRARTELQTTAAAQSEVLRVIGLAQTEFGEYDQAGSNLKSALSSADSPMQRAKVLGSLGVWSAEQAEYAQGIAWMKEALQIMSDKLPITHPDRLEIETDLINFLLFVGEYQQSMDRADQLIAQIDPLDQLPTVDHANVLRSRAMALTQLGRFDEAIEHLQQALELVATLQPPLPALKAAFLNDLGVALIYNGNNTASLDAYYESYQTQIQIYGVAHTRSITSGTNLVLVMRAEGQLQRGLELGEQLLATTLEAHGPVHRSTISARLVLALVLSDSGRNQGADTQLTASIEGLRQLEDMRSWLPNHLAWRGEILIRSGQFTAAIPLLEEAESIRENEFPEVARRYRVASQRRLVQAHAALGECGKAKAYLGGIESDLAAGDATDLLATNIYLLNCQSDRVLAETAYSKILKSLDETGDINASLRGAITWANQTKF